MNFPTLVYRTPGTHQCAGGTYDCIGANTQDHLEALFGEGWFLSLPEAVAGEHAEVLEVSHEGSGQQVMTLSDLPQGLAIQFVQQWLGHRLDEVELPHPETEEGDLLELAMLGTICTYAADTAVQSFKESSGLSAAEWLMDRAGSLGLEPGEELGADELLFLICHAYAKPDDSSGDGASEGSDPTREELEVKAKELSIAFDGRTTDRILAEKIAAALEK